MTTPHTLQAQLEALKKGHQQLHQDYRAERVGRLPAERRLQENAQGGPRYARNLIDPYYAPKEKP